MRIRAKPPSPTPQRITTYPYGSFSVRIPGQKASCHIHPAFVKECRACKVAISRAAGVRWLLAGYTCREQLMGGLYAKGRVVEEAGDAGIIVRRMHKRSDSRNIWNHTLGLMQMLYLREPFVLPEKLQPDEYWFHPKVLRGHLPFVHWMLDIMRRCTGLEFDQVRLVGPIVIRRVLERANVDAGMTIFDRMDTLFAALGYGTKDRRLLRNIITDRPSVIPGEFPTYSTLKPSWHEYSRRVEEWNATRLWGNFRNAN